MIEERGWQGRIIQSGICLTSGSDPGYYEKGLIDKELFRDQLNFFSFDPPVDLPKVRSIIILAVPTLR